MFRSRYVNIATGAGYVENDDKIDFTIDTILGSSDTSIDEDLEHTNVYVYSYINPLRNFTLTVGASGDFTNGDNPDFDDKNSFNPKLGMIWSPLTNTTLRAAAFRVLTRTLVTDQTLEPTQVAGFNQFYDDFEGTEAWRYGGAIDQKFSQNLYGGLEFSKRDLEVPAIDQSGNSIEVDWDEYLGRAYLFWTPHDWLALRAEYQYERFKRDEELTDGIKKLDTHRAPLGINFFHPIGLSASLNATYVYQEGKFERIAGGGGTFEDDDDNYWLVDTSINYRLPKRYGLLTLGVQNLFDEDFKYFEVDFNNSEIQPDRVFFGKITLAFP